MGQLPLLLINCQISDLCHQIHTSGSDELPQKVYSWVEHLECTQMTYSCRVAMVHV